MDKLEKGTKKYYKFIACVALLKTGWKIHISDCDKIGEFLATDPVNREQVMITPIYYGKKHEDLIASIKDIVNIKNIRYIIGVWEPSDDEYKTFLFENKQNRIYNIRTAKASDCWLELIADSFHIFS